MGEDVANDVQPFVTSPSFSSPSTYPPPPLAIGMSAIPLAIGVSAIHPLIVRADGEGGAEGQEVVLPPVLPLPSSARHMENSILVEM